MVECEHYLVARIEHTIAAWSYTTAILSSTQYPHVSERGTLAASSSVK